MWNQDVVAAADVGSAREPSLGTGARNTTVDSTEATVRYFSLVHGAIDACMSSSTGAAFDYRADE